MKIVNDVGWFPSQQLLRIFAVGFLAAAVGGCSGLAYRVPTDAMLPTIGREDMCVVNPLAYQMEEIERFDIVVFEMPDSEKRRINEKGDIKQIKRIVGLPGEKVQIRDNQLFVNDNLVSEPFEKIVSPADFRRNFGPITIPSDAYFLLGDNRPESLDSRYFEPPTVKKNAIYSKVVEIKKGFYSTK